MIETPANSELGVWQAPECPFPIEYSTAVMDDIRAAAVDAFYALRGGAEIGGVLLGKVQQGIRIEGFRAIECEHALGPSFALSDNDKRDLAGLLEELENDGARSGLHPLGWWVSHARSDLLLTGRDLDLYERYFPESWQVTLVLRPAHMKPTRAGFFFRERNGAMQSASSYREFLLHPIPRLKAAAVEPASAPEPAAGELRPQLAPNLAPNIVALNTIAPAPAMEAFREEFESGEPPREASVAGPDETTSRSWKWVWILIMLAAFLFVAGYGARDYWLRLPQDPLSLETTEWKGQLLIHWNGSAAAVRRARKAILEISEGAGKSALELDSKLRRAGAFSFVRQSERVDVRLMLIQPDGNVVEETASFVGKLPSPGRPSPAEADARRQRDELEHEAERMKADILNQALRTRRLERTVENLSRQLSGQKAAKK